MGRAGEGKQGPFPPGPLRRAERAPGGEAKREWGTKYRAAEVPDPLFASAGPALRCSLVTDLLRICSSLAPRSGPASAAHWVRNFCGTVPSRRFAGRVSFRSAALPAGNGRSCPRFLSGIVAAGAVEALFALSRRQGGRVRLEEGHEAAGVRARACGDGRITVRRCASCGSRAAPRTTWGRSRTRS